MPDARRAPALSLLSVAAIALVACGDGSPKLKLGAACQQDTECASGLCHDAECLDPAADNDGDSLTNGVEVALTTDPAARDSDGDGVEDPDELDAALAHKDRDGDGVPDARESRTADADRDCVPDEEDPHDADPVEGQSHPDLASLCPSVGVCAAAGAIRAAHCPSGLDTPACDFAGVPGYASRDDACDGVDADCDGTADEDGACAPVPRGCDELASRVDGRTLLDPDGPGLGFAPFEAECLFSAERGDWVRLEPPVAAALAALAADAPREYLLLAPSGAWYRSPITTRAWDWTQGQAAEGLWVHADGEGALGAFTCEDAAAPPFGVGCVLPSGTAVSGAEGPDPASATFTLCQAIPGAFGPGCVEGVIVYVRLPRCVPDAGQLLEDGGFDGLARGASCWFAQGEGVEGQHWSFPAETHPGGAAPSARADNPVLGNDIWSIQLLQSGLTFVAGRSYRISFWALAGSGRTLRLFVQSRDLTLPLYFDDVPLGVAWTPYERTFTAPGSTWDGMFEFQLGEVSTAPVWLDDVRIVDLDEP